MDEYEDLDMYEGNPIHDINVDFDRHINTGELPEYFEEAVIDIFIDNLNDWDWYEHLI